MLKITSKVLRKMSFSRISQLKLKRRRAYEQKLINGSGLFDENWYKQAYPDVAGFPHSPLAHYLDRGAAEGRAASPLFDTQAYIKANPDVRISGVNPLVHYIEHGAREGRCAPPTSSEDLEAQSSYWMKVINDSELFDEDWYLRTYPDVAAGKESAVRHYIERGAAEGRAAGPFFDTAAYLAANADVAESGINPLFHYIQHGAREGRSFASTEFDIFSDVGLAALVKSPTTAVNWKLDVSDAPLTAQTGARIVLGALRQSRQLRIRFPRALQEGAEGAYAVWLKSEGLEALGFSNLYGSAIDAAFSERFDAAARQFLAYNDELRAAEPLFLLPTGLKRTCQALFAAVSKGDLNLESVWWFLISNAEDVQAALCETWAITPSWQKEVPDGGTVFGIVKLAEWVARRYGCRDHGIFAQDYPRFMCDAAQVRLAYACREDWRSLFPNAFCDVASAQDFINFLNTPASGLHFLPRAWLAERLNGDLAREIAQPGLNILGHFSYRSGLRVSVENIVRGLSGRGIALSLRDVPVAITMDEPSSPRLIGVETYDITLIHIQPEPFFAQVYSRACLSPREPRTYRIGYWYWELDEVPSSWNEAALGCDELWTATEYIAAGLRKRFRQPVHVLSPGLELEKFNLQPRSEFGLSTDEFIFLFVFSMSSILDRKNPFGLIEAFKLAFSKQPRVRLVIKVLFGRQYSDSLESLIEAASGWNISIISDDFTREQTLSLIAVADAYISLHRSEGFGLTMAEAMLLERPVIATRYSGNLQFMNDNNSLLVDCDLIRLQEDTPPYSAFQTWAEPSAYHAANQMLRLFNDPDLQRELGRKGKEDMERLYNYRVASQAICARIDQIYSDMLRSPVTGIQR
ncbi:glycosyltransferase involved in cell wall biosynthesis [Methylobacterium sp. BE186]|uniref:glycosyltransferase family 4 protein n=1 Tax=Methylobacterium sp. BE186 TaxID=2817715 RepID=UPI00285F61E6|nr:glycosyltransferase family 4 protein [Methylobacterium sp. BE186]MDR7039989.1 glycosyltransferase involved in cell wall biosynthesis [Methylobacterium sp. BE186]